MNRRMAAILLAAMLLSLAAGLLVSCAPKEAGITSADQLNQPDVQIGVASDAPEFALVEKDFPQAEIVFTSDLMSALTSVAQGKMDAYVGNRLNMEMALYNGMKGVRLLDETLGEGNVSGVAISPSTDIPDLKGKINEFLKQIKDDGFYAQRFISNIIGAIITEIKYDTRQKTRTIRRSCRGWAIQRLRMRQGSGGRLFVNRPTIFFYNFQIINRIENF